MCIDAGIQAAQGGGNPTGGVYSGTGVTDNGNGLDYDFDPATAGVGVHTITYTYMDGNGCVNSSSDDVEVFALPVVTFVALPDLCIDAGIQAAQGGGNPTGGVYSGTGVTDNGNGLDYDFDPATAGVGVHTITYTYMDGNGCVNSSSDDVEVFALPIVTFTALPDLCIDAGIQVAQGGGNPTGGVYSGPGVTDNGNGIDYDFDPATAGVGVHTITYTYTDGNGCINSASDDVEVFALPVVTFTALADVCIDAGIQSGIGGGSPTGGVYSGTGVTDNGNGTDFDFDPAAAGVGVHTITYTYTDGNGCINSASDDVEVFALPIVTFTALPDLCIDAGIQAGLGGGSPIGGVYSGTGVTDDGNGMTYSFDPAVAGSGIHTITYTYTDGNGCTDSAGDDVEVFDLPVVDFSTSENLCIDSGVQTGLGNGIPSGGVYSGVGVTDDGNGMTYSFDPAIAGVGVHTITYTFTDSNGCIDSASDNIEVFALPVVDFTALASLCIDAGVQTGLTGGTPTGGIYSGSGVTDDGNGMTYSFDPAIAGEGVHTITYTYTDGNGCTDSAIDDVEVFGLPIVEITPLGDLCVDAGVQSGLSGGTPTGGVYSGTGVTDDGNGMTYSFDPAGAGVGTHTITYDYTDVNGCSNSASVDVTVNPLPVPTIDPINPLNEVCIGNGLITLIGNPAGGTFSGIGIIDGAAGVFDPKVAGEGIHTITYEYTDLNGCVASTTIDISVINCFDLALTKVVDPMGPQGPFVIGDQVTFVVTVYNQGQTDAYNVEVEDYLPSNMSFTSSADFTLNGGSYIANIPFIAAGLSQELSITLELSSYDNVDVINNAEIISADDDTNDANTPPEDEDSDLDSIIGSSDDNSELGTDNDIDDEDPGTPGSMDNPLDQDDYDPSLLPILDLANTKTVNAASIAAAGGTFEPNEIITFEVNVFNQGNVTADNIVVTDTIPCGLLYNDVLNGAEGWTLSGTGGSANYTVASLAPGMDTTILISFSIKPSAQVVTDCGTSQAVVPGKPFTNYSFIKSADVDGTVQTEDVDSEFDSFTIEEANTNPNEDGDDDTDSTGNDQEGSQDDNDPALVEVFDLALSKIVSPWELPYQVGETVTFEICVSSQGNVPSDSINIVDYIPAGLEYNTLSDALGWTGTPGNSTATFAFDNTTIPGGQLEFGDQVCTDIILTILANETDFVNRSEITSATSIVDDGMGGSLTSLVTNDNDSQFDAIPFDEAGGAEETESDALTSSTMDPAVLGDGTGTPGSTLASTDDDSSDPAFVPIIDFALRKKVADGNTNPFAVGDTVRFLIEILNQGNVSGSNITVNDYIPNNLAFVDNMTNGDWTGASFGQSNVTAMSTLTGPLAPGEIDSLYIDLEIIGGGSGIEDYTNSAEIFTVFASSGAPTGIADGSDISAFDVDSTPDGNNENDNGADASSPDSPNNPNPADDYVDGNGLDPAGMPDDGVQATDEDDADPALVAFHDVALTKTKPVDQEPVNIGEVVTFTITVFNQGNSPLDSVRIIDYVPAGFAFTPNNNWVADGLNATLTATVTNGLITGGGIPVGGSQEFPIELTVAPTATLTNLVNVAEITGSKDENDLTQNDDGDSTADEILGNDPGGADDTDSDDEVNGDGTGVPGDGVAATDEDDSDPEGVQLALYSIGNQVWIDDNYDGQINGGEVGIDGVAVELYDTSGNLIDMTVTSGGGFYLFDSLLMGDFIVVIPASELAANGSLQDYQSSTGTFNMGGPYEDPGVDANTNIDNDDNGTFDTNTDYPGAVVSTVVTLGGDDEPLNENPDNDAITEDKNENLTIDFGFIEKVYDIALIKETDMETGNSFGDDILFTITVTNQGNTPLTNIEVIDYIAPGFETVPGLNSAITDAGGSGWIDNGTTSSTYVIGDTLLPNESREVGIYLTLVSSLLPDAYVNFAEVSEFQDTIGNSTDGTGPYPEGIEDEDSTPDTMNDNDPGGQPESDSDDSVDGDGTGTVGDDNPLTDEDDHDPSMIQVVDIALAKTTVTPAPYIYGQEVEFNIEVINQGNVDLENILISDYFPCGFTFGPSNIGWTEGTGDATYTIPSLNAGESTNISIYFTVIPVSGSCDYADAYTNFAEVSQMFADYDNDGNFDDDVSLEDADSEADSDNTNDAGGQPQSDADDFVEGDGTGPINDGTDVTDEDDHDPAFITIFDLAQIKFIDNEGPYAIGETATFEFEITNQGNVDAYNIEITDYLSNGFTFSTTGNTGWSVDGDYLVNTIDGPLAPGETVGLTLNLTVALPDAASAASWYNESEISEADDDINPGNEPPTDADSTPDQNPDNDNDLVDGNDDDPIFDPDDDNDNVIDENPNDPFGLGDDDEDDNDAAGILVVGGLGDTVWKDLDGDGIQDAGEPGVEGVEVTLTDCNGNVLATQTTDSDGFYFFNNLLPGDYQVQYDISGLPAGCIFTQQDQGGDDSLDSDVDENGFAPCTTIQGGEYDSTFDAGLAILVNIGDFVWHDTDGDGVQDVGEPGIPDVMVLLYNEDNELIQVTMTDQDGMYLFTNVLPDTYYIVFVDPDGFVSTFPDTTDDENDSDITNFVFTDEGSTTDLFTIEYGQEDDLSFDAGFYRCIPIGERVWYDVDEDDLFDATENGINGLEVNLYRLDGGSYSLYETQLTGLKPGTPSDDGYYKFCAPPGTYYVEVVMPPIGLVLAKSNALNNLPLTHPNESTEDSDMTNNFGQSTTASFTVESGEMLCNIGSGFYPMAEVGNRVWMDSNENGTQDSGEGNVSNVLVEAFEVETGEKVAESVTNDLGIYNIDYLQKKEYYLKFTPPNGLSFTDPNTGDEDTDSDVDHTFGFRTTSAFSLSPGEAIINVDAGLRFGALPVVWLSVDAEHFGEYNLVTWKTASEVNTESFIVERSINSIDKFEAIGEVDAAGESTTIQAYAFEDENIRPGTYYYRIKQLDKDGKFDYSDIVLLKVISEKNEITLAPNPARGKSILTIDLESGQETSVSVIGSDGRLIRTMTIEAVTGQGISTTLDIDELPTGVYSIYINQGTFTEIKKLIIIE
ncbi:MAG: SdrD B-like domain-containing protein [Saprospiraceae bacterium]|nr:SdrD B-like domain-containing protein [Saprospiraceae bacterium]